MKVRREAFAVIVGAMLFAFAMNGCSGSVHVGSSSDTISASDVASKARDELSKKFTSQGLPALPPVTCDGDLDRKVGDSTHCEAKGDFGKVPGTLGLTATVASVDGDHTELHFETNKAGIQTNK